LAATYGRLCHLTVAFVTLGLYAHLRLHKEERLLDMRDELLVLARIRLQNVRHRALLAQLRRPWQFMRVQQPASFNVAAAVIISVEVAALLAGRGDHPQIIATAVVYLACKGLTKPK
jgi:hypothetical protein